MSKRHDDLVNAYVSKKDEFYTARQTIEDELQYYESFFKNKIVYCNCDSDTSEFFKYFKDNFFRLKLKNLVASCYDPDGGKVFKYDGYAVATTALLENGSYKCDECLKLLNECDVVVTNPPFSLFRDYIATLIKYNKKFLILGNMNASIYKDIFYYFRQYIIWYGVSIHSGDRKFLVPDDYPLKANSSGIDKDGNRYIKVKGCRWFTNIEHGIKYNYFNLVAKYSPDRYDRIDKFGIVNIDSYKDIPCDYFDVMAVPITYFDHTYSKEFEIVVLYKRPDGSVIASSEELDYPCATSIPGLLKNECVVDGKRKYVRITIRRKFKKSN